MSPYKHPFRVLCRLLEIDPEDALEEYDDEVIGRVRRIISAEIQRRSTATKPTKTRTRKPKGQ